MKVYKIKDGTTQIVPFVSSRTYDKLYYYMDLENEFILCGCSIKTDTYYKLLMSSVHHLYIDVDLVDDISYDGFYIYIMTVNHIYKWSTLDNTIINSINEFKQFKRQQKLNYIKTL